MALSWHFMDEGDEAGRALAARAAVEGVHVPAHWPAEIANGLLIGVRRKRTDEDAVGEFLARIEVLPTTIQQIEPEQLYHRVLPLARQHRLTVYDALYLDLAQRMRLPIATLDRALAEAARTLDLTLIGDQA